MARVEVNFKLFVSPERGLTPLEAEREDLQPFATRDFQNPEDLRVVWCSFRAVTGIRSHAAVEVRVRKTSALGSTFLSGNPFDVFNVADVIGDFDSFALVCMAEVREIIDREFGPGASAALREEEVFPGAGLELVADLPDPDPVRYADVFKLKEGAKVAA